MLELSRYVNFVCEGLLDNLTDGRKEVLKVELITKWMTNNDLMC